MFDPTPFTGLDLLPLVFAGGLTAFARYALRRHDRQVAAVTVPEPMTTDSLLDTMFRGRLDWPQEGVRTHGPQR